jgi:dihydrofolate synthase/folylpolyglutamate synthase
LRPLSKLTSLEDWLNYIRSLHPEEIDLNLDRVKRLAQKANLLNFKCPVILVGGTNGKGSTVSALSALFKAKGLLVGSYYSPHLFRFNERIQLNGECIEDEVLCRLFSEIEHIRQEDKQAQSITVFEFITLAALQFFKEAHCDILVLEIGLGGRLDAVNIVEPTLSIITTLGLDHTDRLGDTVEQIAIEKAGIFRPNKGALVGQQACHPVLLEEAKRQGVVLLQEGIDFGWKEREWYYGQERFSIPSSHLPIASLSLALAAFQCLTSELANTDLKPILDTAVLPGRFQRDGKAIETIFDVAHNPLGAQWLKGKLEGQNSVAVWSSFKDKDLQGIVAAMQDKVRHWVIAPLDHERAASLEYLKQCLEKQGICSTHIFCEATLALAYKKAYSLASIEDKIVVFGSFATVNEVVQSLATSN